MKNYHPYLTFRQQLGQGLIVASVLGAVLMLGTACAPVTNSVSKLPRTDRTRITDTELSGRSFVSLSETHVVAERDYLTTVRGLPAGLTEYTLTEEEVKSLRKRGSTLVRLETVGSVEIHTVLELTLPAEKIEAQGLRRVKASWLTVNPKVSSTPPAAEFVLSLYEDEEAGHKSAMKHLKSVTIHHRILN